MFYVCDVLIYLQTVWTINCTHL